MKLQRVESRSVGDRTYHKYVLTLPEEVVTAAGWEAGGEVLAKVKGREVVLSYTAEKGGAPRERDEGSGYDAFRDRIRAELAVHPEGFSWPELRDRLRLPQKVPNNVWVRRLEHDIKLLRLKEPSGTRWRLG